MGVLLLALVLPFLHAEPADFKDFAGRSEMNGIKFAEFQSFPQTWRPVTVRYRQDTKEMRFVFANPAGSASLQKGEDFPDGAVLGKVGRAVAADPAFTSSLVPAGAKRFQLMVRDRKRFASTGGWGYALFDQNGKTFAENPKAATEACFACHQLVKNRFYVFSQFADLTVNKSIANASIKTETVHFEKLHTGALMAPLRHWLRESDQEAYQISGDLRGHVFPGTLDEITPALEQQVLKTRLPAFLLAKDEKRFSLVIIDSSNRLCGGAVPLMSIRYAPEIKGGYAKKSFCGAPPN